MFSSILVPLDGSDLAEQAIAAAVRLIAGGQGGMLHLVTVHQAPVLVGELGEDAALTLDESIREREIRYLEQVAIRLKGRVPRVQVHLQEGRSPAAALVEYLEANGVDSVVLTSHGRTGFSRVWLGSVAEGVMHRSPVPVVCLKRNGAPLEAGGEGLERILVPLDGSADAEAVLEPALAFARRVGGLTLELLRVVTPVAPWHPDVMAGMLVQVAMDPTRQQLEANRYLHALAMKLRAAGHRVHAEVLVDANPAGVIVEHARRQPGTAVALGIRHRAGLERLLMGKVADKVLRAATGPVLTQLVRREEVLAPREIVGEAVAVGGR